MQYFTHKWLITAISFIIIIGSAVPANSIAADVGTKPTRKEILALLRLMSLDHREYLCNKEIMRKESNYNPSAKNGSHYGLYQGRSQYLATATIKEQIQWYIKYIRSRYGEGCQALKHHQKHNWY